MLYKIKHMSYYFYKNSKQKRKAISLVYKETQKRFIYCLFCFLSSSILSMAYGKEILYIYLFPITAFTKEFVYTSITEAFSTIFCLSLTTGLMLTFPFGLYLFCCFFLPSLFPEEKAFFSKTCFFILVSYLLCIYGVYVFFIPELFSWFLKYAAGSDFISLSFMAKLSTIVFLCQKVYMIFLHMFILPIAFWVFLNNKPEKERTGFFSKNRKYIYICFLLFCALISTPDFYSQGFLFGFSLCFFEFILWQNFLKKALYKKRKQ